MMLTLVSPLQGWAGPLAELPDAAFAGGMVGDGVAIDPIGAILHAPCAGIVLGIHRARHAVTLRGDGGAEILCHIGIETVGLAGAGFTAHVAEGDRVAAGAPLISFDLDTVARGAVSLASPILITDTAAFRISRRAADTRLAVGDWLMDVERVEGPAEAPAARADAASRLSREIALPAGHGIHARPAAAIVACAKRFAAAIEISTVTAAQQRTSPASSAAGLMTLGLAGGDRLLLSAQGADAAAAIEAIARLIEHGLEGGHARRAAGASIGRRW